MDAVGFHDGELAVQRRAGVEHLAARLSGMLEPPRLGGGVSRFLADRELAMLTARDAAGRLWTSPLFGARGFLEAFDGDTGPVLRVFRTPGLGDPLHDLPPGQPVAVLALDLATRRRLRVNGTLAAASTSGLEVAVDQAYGNCPSYIQSREVRQGVEPAGTPHARAGGALRPEDVELVRRADTFILGTTHPERGTDTSHRGGAPGFVRVEGGGLWWPDYPGNNLFNSLGNIAVDPEASLLFLDFDAGATLQLSGEARLEWRTPGRSGDDGGTGRRVRFTPRHVVALEGLGFGASDAVASPRNPELSA